MEGPLVEWVYESLCGMLIEERQLPGVENAFEEGKTCQKLYAEVYGLYDRICGRNRAEADEDVDKIIHNMMEIARILGCKMFAYGAKLGK